MCHVGPCLCLLLLIPGPLPRFTQRLKVSVDGEATSVALGNEDARSNIGPTELGQLKKVKNDLSVGETPPACVSPTAFPLASDLCCLDNMSRRGPARPLDVSFVKTCLVAQLWVVVCVPHAHTVRTL